MWKSIILLVAAIFLLSSCAMVGKSWRKDGVSQSEFDRDLAECKYDAAKHSRPGNYRTGIVEGLDEGLQRIDLTIQCMEAKGYRRVDKTTGL